MSSYAQDNGDYKGLGGLLLRMSIINESPNLAVGGYGGFVYKSKIALGGFGLGYINDVENQSGNLIDINGGGFFMSYYVNDKFHIPVMLEWNDIEVRAVQVSEIETMSFIPGLEYNFPVKEFLRIGVCASYRKSFMDANEYFNPSEFDGANLSVRFRFENF